MLYTLETINIRGGTVSDNIGIKIKERREELGLSQQELAERLGYTTRSTVCKVENGDNDISRTKILAYATALEVSPVWLLGLSDNKHIYTDLDQVSFLFSSLTDDNKVEVIKFIKYLLYR